MRFTIKREEFLKGLNIAARAVASKTGALPILNNFKLELNENGLYITGSNYDLSIRTLISYKKDGNEIIRNFKEGSTLLNAKILNEIARKMDSDEITIDVFDTTIAVISDNRSEYRLNSIRPEEYPDLDLEPVGVQLNLSKDEFSTLVAQTAFAASLKEQRPLLTAINLEAADGVLTATTTDSARLARKTMNIAGNINFVANVPAKMMVEVDHLLETSDKVDISFSDKKALFSFDGTVVATRLISGDYPNTKNILPRVTNYSLEVNSKDLMKAIDRANILSLDRENVVDLTMSEDGITVSAKSSQAGSAVEKIEMFKFEGGNLQVSFNSEFVLAAIRALNCDDVTFLFVGEMKPFVIKNASDESVVQIVTPVRTF